MKTTFSVDELRQQHYNARVVDIHKVHDDLMILQVRSDLGRLKFQAGQYAVLALGNWEPAVTESAESDSPEPGEPQLIKRPYSISCTLLGKSGGLIRATRDPVVEFFVVLVRNSRSGSPGLTPRLFHLAAGDRLYLSREVHGRYLLGALDPESQVVFVATGTGEAPHNTMLAELLARGHRGKIVAVTCVRHRRDLGYLQKHRELERRFPQYRYLTLTTREPENLDATLPGFVGKRHLQEYFESGDFERDAGLALRPETTHVYLCGSPDMIGVPIRTSDPARRYPVPKGMIEVLERRGFHIDLPHQPGNVHFEKYW